MSRPKRRKSAARPPRRLGLSLCMIVRNEQRFLEDCLSSVRDDVDEICIVDTGSTDGTVAIAERFGARVERVEWRDDFAWARNQALAMATKPWILVLDADERLAPTSRAELQLLVSRPPAGRGYWVRCRNLNDDIRGGGASSNALVRLFPNEPNVRYRGAIHEYVSRDGAEHGLPSDGTQIEILHYGYTSATVAERHKGERNLRVAQAALEAHPDDHAVRYNYAASALLAGDKETARIELERVCDATENTPRGFRPQALAMLAGLHLELDAGRGLATADRCLAVTSNLPDGHFVRGQALAVLGRFHEARDAFAAAIEAGRFGHQHFVVNDEIAVWLAHNEIARTLMHEKRWADAERWLDLALEARPRAMLLILNKARCREEQGDLERALVLFRAALEGYRDQTAAIDYVNFVFRHGSPDIALTAVEQALPVVEPDYQRAFLTTVAGEMLRAGRRTEAAQLIGRALAVDGAPEAGRAIVRALAKHHGMPELAALAAPAEVVRYTIREIPMVPR